MLFNTWLYAIFLGTVVALYWSLPFAVLRPWILIAAGLVFYAYAFPPHALLVLGLALFTWILGESIRRASGPRRIGRLATGLTVTVGFLAYFKYADFLRELAGGLVGSPSIAGLPTSTGIHAPLAISFFTFEFVHYLVEVHRGTVRANLRDFLLFILFFPTLVCGPIKRYQNFALSLDYGKRLDWLEVGAGLERILFGFSKKIIVADSLARLTAPVWASPLDFGSGILWLAAYGYAFQIYMDFSGYSDIAIGSAKLLGFKVEENFRWPYLQSNIRDFWRSWHISLSSWITDYLYIPLGGNRGGRVRAIVNTMVAMAICGLWHGAAVHFVAWGLYHGAALSVHRVYRDLRVRRSDEVTARFPLARRFGAVLLTFHVVVVGWVFFILDTGPACRVVIRMLSPWA
jgi:alginate O-acetyltransferase complex protein AlgI